MLVVPCVLIGLLAWMYSGTDEFDQIGAPLLGIFPFVVMFLVTSVATLRERQSGTLERLLAMPLGKGDLVGGYARRVRPAGRAAGRASASAFAIWVCGLDVAGPVWLLLVVAVVDALLGCTLGLFVSAFAATEFQAVQFLPAVVLPQFLLCGLFAAPRPAARRAARISNVLPLSYAVDADDHGDEQPGRHVRRTGDVASCWVAVAGRARGGALAAVVLGAATLRRRTP